MASLQNLKAQGKGTQGADPLSWQEGQQGPQVRSNLYGELANMLGQLSLHLAPVPCHTTLCRCISKSRHFPGARVQTIYTLRLTRKPQRIGPKINITVQFPQHMPCRLTEVHYTLPDHADLGALSSPPSACSSPTHHHGFCPQGSSAHLLATLAVMIWSSDSGWTDSYAAAAGVQHCSRCQLPKPMDQKAWVPGLVLLAFMTSCRSVIGSGKTSSPHLSCPRTQPLPRS